MNTQRGRLAVAACSLFLVAQTGSSPLSAGETVVYTYDELGRLIKSARSGEINNGVATDIEYDPAGNRVEYAVSGSSGSGNFPTETPPSFSIAANKSASEGSAMTFTVNRSKSTDVTYSVFWSTRTGSAGAQDFVAGAGTLTFAPQENSRTFSVQTNQDTVSEQNEVFHVDLIGASSNATFGTKTRTGTITDGTGSNTPPATTNDSGSVAKCGAVTLNVISNDTDADGDTPLQVVAVGSTPMGQTSVANSSSVTFTAYNSSGSASFSYTVRDTRGAESMATVAITVTTANQCL